MDASNEFRILSSDCERPKPAVAPSMPLATGDWRRRSGGNGGGSGGGGSPPTDGPPAEPACWSYDDEHRLATDGEYSGE